MGPMGLRAGRGAGGKGARGVVLGVEAASREAGRLGPAGAGAGTGAGAAVLGAGRGAGRGAGGVGGRRDLCGITWGHPPGSGGGAD